VPHAIKLHNELGGRGLEVLLAEVQGATFDDLHPFMLRNFPDNRAMVIAGSVPIQMVGKGIPQSALVGVDGTVLMVGSPGDLAKKMEKAIQDELAKLKTGWGQNAVAKKARAALYGKRSPVEAKAALQSGDAGPEASEVEKEIETWVRTRKKMISFLQEDGQWQRANEEAQTLAKGVKGGGEWEESSKRIIEQFEAAEARRELELDKRFAPAVKRLEELKLKVGDAKAFRASIKPAEGTKVGARLSRIADALEKAERLKRA
jgi:hypothetical protein